MISLWIVTTTGLPIAADFGTTSGQGSPLCLNAANGKLYYLAAGEVVTEASASAAVPTGTGFRAIVAGVEAAAAKLVDTADINPDQVTYAKIQNVSVTARLLGRATAAAGDIEEITLGTNLSFTGTTLNAASAAVPTGTGFRAIVAGAESAAAKLVDTADINNAQVTLVKQADMATASLVYRKTAAAGVPEINTLATLKTDLLLTGTNSGDQTSVSGNAGTATALATGRTIAMTGDVVWTSPAFNGTANVTAAGSIQTGAVIAAKIGADAVTLPKMATAQASIMSVYVTLFTGAGRTLVTGNAATTYAFPAAADVFYPTGAGAANAPFIMWIDPADFPTIGTLTAKMRVRVVTNCNDVAPGGNYTYGLHPVTRPATSGGAGLNIFTIGAAVGTTVPLTTPAADSQTSSVTADFAVPAAGFYVIGLVTTAIIAANAHVAASAQLQLRYT